LLQALHEGPAVRKQLHQHKQEVQQPAGVRMLNLSRHSPLSGSKWLRMRSARGMRECWRGGRFLVSAAAVLIASHAGAQEVRVPDNWSGTGFVVSQPSLRDGKTVNCSLVFRAFIQDRIYREGEPSIVSGSFGFAKIQDTVGAFLKVVVEDLSMDSGELRKSFATPVSSYVASRGGQTTVSSRVQMSPTEPGALFTIFVADDAFFRVYEALIRDGAATVWFSRRPGGLDVPVEIDLRVTSTENGRAVRSTKELAAFADCLSRLMQ